MYFVIAPPGTLSQRNNPVVGGDPLSRIVSLKISLFRTRGSWRRRIISILPHIIRRRYATLFNFITTEAAPQRT